MSSTWEAAVENAKGTSEGTFSQCLATAKAATGKRNDDAIGKLKDLGLSDDAAKAHGRASIKELMISGRSAMTRGHQDHGEAQFPED